MAEIVLGIGTSHGPMLVTETELWGSRISADMANKHPWHGRSWTFDELVEARNIGIGASRHLHVLPAVTDN